MMANRKDTCPSCEGPKDVTARTCSRCVTHKRLPAQAVQKIKAMRADGRTIHETAEAVGCSPGTVRNHTPGRPGKVDNAPLREAFLASHRTASDVALSLGWWDGGSPDTSRVKRTLGIQDDVTVQGGKTYRSRRRLIDAETAGLIAEALGMGAWELEEAA